jgi:hypothetical protein
MFTITKSQLWRSVWHLAIAALAWIGVVAGTAIVTQKAPAFVVILPSKDLWQRPPQGAAVLSVTRLGQGMIAATFASDSPGFVAQLYGAGAWIVLPAGLQGCSGRAAQVTVRN